LWAYDGGKWNGYLLTSKSRPGLKKAVIGNVSWEGTNASIPSYGLNAWLAPGDYRIIDVK
jgi:hypothetical protein